MGQVRSSSRGHSHPLFVRWQLLTAALALSPFSSGRRRSGALTATRPHRVGEPSGRPKGDGLLPALPAFLERVSRKATRCSLTHLCGVEAGGRTAVVSERAKASSLPHERRGAAASLKRRSDNQKRGHSVSMPGARSSVVIARIAVIASVSSRSKTGKGS